MPANPYFALEGSPKDFVKAWRTLGRRWEAIGDGAGAMFCYLMMCEAQDAVISERRARSRADRGVV